MDVGTRVLVIEDDPDAAEVMGVIFGFLGHTCRVAHSGEEALSIARDFEPRIVTLDLGLPDGGGFEVARMLRAQPGGAAIHIVAVTGHSDDARRDRALVEGFDDYLVKPVSIATLELAVADAA